MGGVIPERIEMHLKYLLYVLRHKWFVFLAGLKVKAPLWQLVIHDWTKFLPDEWFPYVDMFYNKPKQEKEFIDVFSDWKIAEAAPYGYFVKDRFNYAWLHHQRRNKHHWQYWYLMQDNDGDFPMEMPEKYVREMVADWAGAGRAITGKWEVKRWYELNRRNIKIDNDTRARVESLIELV